MYATSEEKTNGGFAMIEETLKRVKKANAYLLVTKKKESPVWVFFVVLFT